MPRFERKYLLERFHDLVRRRIPIIGGGAGTGISAKCEEAGGIDLIVVYNSGRFRMAGLSSSYGNLPIGNANETVREMAGEILRACPRTPALAGVYANDPFRNMPAFLKELKGMGFSGIQNFPTIGRIDGSFRQSLEEGGITFGAEIDLVRTAHELDLLTTPYVFDVEQAAEMTAVGADFIVPHFGVTVGGSIGVTSSFNLDDAVRLIDEWGEAARRVRKDVLIIAHGGPIATPADLEYVMERSEHCNGFYGASSMERLPVEVAITTQIRSFKQALVKTTK